VEDKISILLEVIGREQARLDQAARGIDNVTKANQRSERATAAINQATQRQAQIADRANRAFMEVTAAIREQARLEQTAQRAIDQTTKSIEKRTAAQAKAAQTIARQKGPNTATDPNAFFREELAKEQAAAQAVSDKAAAANAARAAALTAQRQRQALADQKAAVLAETANTRSAIAEQQLAKAAIATETALIRKQQAQEKARKATESGAKVNEAASRTLGNLRNALFAVQAAVVAAAVAFTPLVISINRMEDVGRLSQKVGITTEAISQLGFAANEEKISFDQLSLGLKGFSKAITDAEVRGSNAQRGFSALGISVRDGNGNLKGTLPLILEVANAFSKYKDDAAKATVAQFLFEESGVNFIPLLNKGAAGLAELAAKADQYGLTISGAQAAQATQFNQQVREMRQIVTGAATTIATEILPALIDFTKFLIENRTAVIGVVVVVGTLTTGVIAAAAAMKAYALATSAGAVAFGPYIAAAAAAAAAIIAVNEALKAGNALMQEQASLTGVQQQQAEMTKRLRAEIALLKERGQLTEDQANRARAALNKAQLTGDVETQQRALKIVRNTVREAEGLDRLATTAEAKTAAAKANVAGAFAEAARNAPGAGGTANGEKPGINLPTAQALRDKERLVEIAREMDHEILESRAKRANEEVAAEEAKGLKTIEAINQNSAKRLQAEALTRQAAAAQELVDEEKRRRDIMALEGISEAERNTLLEQARQLHITRMNELERQSADFAIAEAKRAHDQKVKLMEMQLSVAEGTFGNIAGAIKDFGLEGSTAFKVFATAQAVMSTALGAIGAFTQASAAFPPPYGQIVGAIAAGAVVAFGAAQIAKINGAFAEGGIVPGTPSATDNRVAAVATGELIISARSTQSLIRQGGAGAINALLGGQMPYGGEFVGGYIPRSSASAFASGGVVGPTPEMSRGTNVDITLAEIRDRQTERDQMARDSALIIVDKLNRRGNRLKV
jgi:hypothetical protein